MITEWILVFWILAGMFSIGCIIGDMIDKVEQRWITRPRPMGRYK